MQTHRHDQFPEPEASTYADACARTVLLRERPASYGEVGCILDKHSTCRQDKCMWHGGNFATGLQGDLRPGQSVPVREIGTISIALATYQPPASSVGLTLESAD